MLRTNEGREKKYYYEKEIADINLLDEHSTLTRAWDILLHSMLSQVYSEESESSNGCYFLF